MLSQRSLGAGYKKATPSDDEFNRVSFLAHMEGANNGVNVSYEDSSSSNHTLTETGNTPVQGSFGPFAREEGYWGVEFDGSDGIKTPASGVVDFGTGDFTIEAFFNSNVVDSSNDTIIQNWGGGTGNPVGLAVNRGSTGGIQFYIGSSLILDTGANAFSANTWNHLAVARSGTSLKMFVNGSVEVTATNSGNITVGNSNVSVGYDVQGTNNYFNGSLSNVRIVKGAAVYTSAFTPTTAPLTAITNTQLLTCQSNRFVDNSASARTLTPVGNPSVSAFGPFLTDAAYDPAVNGASAYFDGSENKLTAPDSADWDFGSGNYTVEFWIYPRTTGILQGLVNQWGDFNTTNVAWSFEWHSDGNINYYIKTNTASYRQLVAAGGASIANQWMHVAAARNNNVHTLYLDGVSKATVTDAGTMNNCTSTLIVGDYFDNNYSFDGEICDVRVVKGTAVYTGNFTPPTAPLTAITNTKLLVNMANGQAIDSAAQNNLTLIGGAKISTAQYKFGDSSMVFDGTGDHTVINNAPTVGSGDFTIEFWARRSASDDGGFFQFSAAALDAASGAGPGIGVNSASTVGGMYLYYGKTGALQSKDLGGTLPSVGTWFHVAYVRSSGVIQIYVDGTAYGSTTASTVNYTDSVLTIGGWYDANYLFHGNIDEFRISHMARYTSNFTPATEPFADKGE